jgi:hypothetical protein
VEFVLPCLSQPDFQTLAADWSGLNDYTWSGPKPNYQRKLEGVLSKWLAQAAAVRLRINGKNGKGSDTWDTREFAFQNGGLKIRDLERQPNSGTGKIGACVTGDNPLAVFARQNQAAILTSSHEFTNTTLATKNETVIGLSGFAITLGSDVCPGGPTDAVRYSLSINSCLGCHGVETKTEFHHIAQRDPGVASNLSGFLTGAADCQSGGQISATDYCTVTAPPVSGCGPAPASRQFNDLLRRHLYSYTVGQLKAGDDWKKKLAPFTAHQTD